MMKFLIVPVDGSPAHLLDVVYANTQQLKEQGKIRIFELIATSNEGSDLDVEEVDEQGIGHEIPTL